MVKRQKSPDIIEEVRYFTVCQPFPLNANWKFPEDQQGCATWIAECIGLEHLYGIHYKPSARGMILLEVSKTFTQHERLLGEHRWSEILTDPDEEEEKRVSRVFHSFYAKGRDAQKDGWKGLVVNASWFKNWSPGNGRFKQPYPQTHWCPIPVEDQTNKALCRPLPVDRMPPPPRIEPPVVGSANWIQKKNSGKPTVEALKMSYDEDISSVEAVNKLNERAQAKLNAGFSSSPVLNERSPSTASPNTARFYPSLAAGGITTSAPNKTQAQATSNLVPLGKNKKAKPTPLSQFIAGEGGKKSTPANWNKVAPVQSASLNGPLPKPTPQPANAWAKPIKLKVAPVAAAVKKETPSEDYSSWGQESATSTVDQENIWKSPPKSKKGKGRADTSSTSQESTRPSSPQVSNIPTPTISSTTPDVFTRDVPPHQIYRFTEEEDDSDDDIYVPFSDMKVSDIDDFAPEEMGYADVNVNAGGSGDAANALDSVIPVPVEGRKYENLWLSEDDPRAIPAPAIVCPVHRLGCNKGICEVLGKMHRDIKKAEERAKWEKEKKNKGKKKKQVSGSDDAADGDEVDGDNFTKVVARPKGNNRGSSRKRIQENEPSFTGRMRAFPDDPVPSDYEPDAAANGGPNVGSAPGTEGQLFDQW